MEKPENYEEVKEYESKARPNVLATLSVIEEVNTDSRILKFCDQYRKGLLSSREVEQAIRLRYHQLQNEAEWGV